jgi:hypothetical protein
LNKCSAIGPTRACSQREAAISFSLHSSVSGGCLPWLTLIVGRKAMEMPKHIWRCPTREAIDKLAARFGLPNDPRMQDWEYQVADPMRVDEFLAAYQSGDLSDDEKFTLMETIIESFNLIGQSGGDLAVEPRWQRTLALLDNNLPLHAYSIWYWSCVEAQQEDEIFCLSPFIRRLFAKHQDYFAEPGPSPNSGPMKPPANSGVAGGPTSVN